MPCKDPTCACHRLPAPKAVMQKVNSTTGLPEGEPVEVSQEEAMVMMFMNADANSQAHCFAEFASMLQEGALGRLKTCPPSLFRALQAIRTALEDSRFREEEIRRSETAMAQGGAN